MLRTEPNRFRSILGKARAAKQSGDPATARDAYQKLVALSKPAVRAPRAGRGQGLSDELTSAVWPYPTLVGWRTGRAKCLEMGARQQIGLAGSGLL